MREVQNVESEKRKLANQKFQAGLRVCYTRFYSFEFCHRIFRPSVLPFFKFWNLWSDILWGAILVDQYFCAVWLFAFKFSPAKFFSEFLPNTKLYLETGKIYEPWLIHISLDIIANIMKQSQIFIEFWYPRYSLRFIYKKKSFMFQNYDIIIKAIFTRPLLQKGSSLQEYSVCLSFCTSSLFPSSNIELFVGLDHVNHILSESILHWQPVLPCSDPV